MKIHLRIFNESIKFKLKIESFSMDSDIQTTVTTDQIKFIAFCFVLKSITAHFFIMKKLSLHLKYPFQFISFPLVASAVCPAFHILHTYRDDTNTLEYRMMTLIMLIHVLFSLLYP